MLSAISQQIYDQSFEIWHKIREQKVADISKDQHSEKQGTSKSKENNGSSSWLIYDNNTERINASKEHQGVYIFSTGKRTNFEYGMKNIHALLFEKIEPIEKCRGQQGQRKGKHNQQKVENRLKKKLD